MTKQILVGYIVDKNNPVKFYMPEKHTVICGMTGEGKTVLFERIVAEWPEQKFVIFVSKIGEEAFPGIPKSKPYFKQKDASNWRYVRDLIEVSEEKRLSKHEESFLVRRCAGARTLADVHKNIKARMKDLEKKNKTENIEYGDLVLLEQYLQKLIEDWQGRDFSTKLDLSKRITVFDISDMPTSLQAAVVASVIEAIHFDKDLHHIAVCVPEAWQLLPADRGSPALAPAEIFARQGRVRHNWLIIDTQDLAGVNGRKILINVHNYFLGRQQYRHEVERTRDTLPVPARIKPAADDIMNLKTGQFYAVAGQRDEAKINLIYAWPVWLDEPSVIEVAKDPNKVYQYMKRTDIKTYFDSEESMSAEAPAAEESAEPAEVEQEPQQPALPVLDLDHRDDDQPEPKAPTLDGVIKSYVDEAVKREVAAQLAPLGEMAGKCLQATVDVDNVNISVVETLREETLTEATTIGKLAILMAEGKFDGPKSLADLYKMIKENWDVDKTSTRFYNNELKPALLAMQQRPYRLVDQTGELWQPTEKGKAIKKSQVKAE